MADNIKAAPTAVIKAMHKLIFAYEGDRSNRKRLGAFEGFKFAIDSGEYTEKTKYAKHSLSERDLTSIANILCVDYNQTNKDTLIAKICSVLINLVQLENSIKNSEDVETEDDDVVEEQMNQNV